MTCNGKRNGLRCGGQVYACNGCGHQACQMPKCDKQGFQSGKCSNCGKSVGSKLVK